MKYKESRARANAKYDAANTVQVHLKLNLRTDADILEALAHSGNKQGYLKQLVRADLKKRAKKRDKQCEDCAIVDCDRKSLEYPCALYIKDESR